MTSSAKARLEALKKQKENLKIAMLQAEIQKPKYTKEQTVSWISHFKYGDVNSYEYQKRIIYTFVNAIYLFDGTLAITYNFNCCTEVITLKNIEAVYGSDLNVLFPLISESRNIPAFFAPQIMSSFTYKIMTACFGTKSVV